MLDLQRSRSDAALLWDEAPDNLSYRFERGDKPVVDTAFATAAHIVETELINNRLITAPIEARAATWRARVLPIIAAIRSTGVTSPNEIARELERRAIKTLRGGGWRGATVRRLLVS